MKAPLKIPLKSYRVHSRTTDTCQNLKTFIKLCIREIKSGWFMVNILDYSLKSYTVYNHNIHKRQNVSRNGSRNPDFLENS